MEIKWTPTELMWCDILTKPKQGQVFREFRGFLMNGPIDYLDAVEPLLTHPQLLPQIKPSTFLSPNDRSILLKAGITKKRAKIYFATAVSFDNKSTATANSKFRKTLS